MPLRLAHTTMCCKDCLSTPPILRGCVLAPCGIRICRCSARASPHTFQHSHSHAHSHSHSHLHIPPTTAHASPHAFPHTHSHSHSHLHSTGTCMLPRGYSGPNSQFSAAAVPVQILIIYYPPGCSVALGDRSSSAPEAVRLGVSLCRRSQQLAALLFERSSQPGQARAFGPWLQ